jgi:hypothetical protein
MHLLSGKYARAAMKSLNLPAALAAILLICTPVLGRDNGQFANVPDSVRAWFKSVKSLNGEPCCDIADGHRTEFDIRQNQYWVPINGNWVPVPAEAVLKNVGNPVGDAVVWYSEYGGHVVIRCFVPGDGA